MNMISEILGMKKRLNPKEKNEPEKIAGLFPKGYLSIVASAAGTGKTWFMLYLSCQLSIGGRILKGLSTERPRNILIFSGETGNEILNIRLSKTQWNYNPNNIAIYSALDFGTKQIPYLINEPSGQNTLELIIDSERPDILFFDTLISFHGLDESKQGDMTKVYMTLCRWAKKYDMALVCNHHTRKRPADNPNRIQNQDDVIGTSAGVRVAHQVFIISQDDNIEQPKMYVTNVKSWDKKLQPFSYQFVDVNGMIDFAINRAETVQKKNIKDRIINLFNMAEPDTYFRFEDIANQLDVTTKSVKEAIKIILAEKPELIALGRIGRTPMVKILKTKQLTIE